MLLRFVGLAHLTVYRGSEDPWAIGVVREVTEARGLELLAHGGFERTDAHASCPGCVAKDAEIARLIEQHTSAAAAHSELTQSESERLTAQTDAVRSERDAGAIEIERLRAEIARLEKKPTKRG